MASTGHAGSHALGGDRIIRVNVRIIAATYRNLEALVAQRLFREDLYYRLDVSPIHVPPLRDRAAEIPALAREILGDLARRFGVAEPALDRRALTRLRAYAWPGDVRELRNVLERSLLLRREGKFEVDLPPPPRASARSFEQAAREAIEAALLACEGRAPERPNADFTSGRCHMTDGRGPLIDARRRPSLLGAST